MSWLTQILVAEALSSGGVLVAADPAAMPLAEAQQGVRYLCPHMLWQVAGLGAGDAMARDLNVRSGEDTDGPVVAFLTAADQLDAFTALAGRRPDVVVAESMARQAGYAALSPQCPQIAMAPSLMPQAQRTRRLAEDLVAGRVSPSDVIPSHVAARAGASLHQDLEGAFALGLDPLRTLRALDRDGAFALAVHGCILLHLGRRWTLRLPTLGLECVEVLLRFTGPPPHRPPSVQLALGDADLITRVLPLEDGLQLHVSMPTGGAAWRDVLLTGNRLELRGIEIPLPSLGPAPEDDRTTLDPLQDYGDPLARFADKAAP